MEKNKRGIFDFIFRHRSAVIFSAVFIWILAIIAAGGMKLEENFLKLLPDNDRTVSEYRQLIEAFDLMDLMFIIIGNSNENNAGEDSLVSASDAFCAKLLSSGLFEKVNKDWNYDDVFAALEVMKKNRANMFSETYKKDIEEKFCPGEMDKRISGWKKTLTESPVPMMGKIFREDPFGMNSFILDELNSFRSFGKPLKVYRGRLFTGDGKHLLIFAKPKKGASDIEFSKELKTFMDGAVSEISSGKKVRISYLSGHRFSVENSEKMKRGAKISIMVSSIAIIIFSLLFYSRPFLVPLTLLPAFFGCTFALGFTSFVSPWVSAISIGCGTILLGITVDYGIYILYQVDRFSGAAIDENEVKGLLKDIRTPLLMAAATTGAAFMTLFFSPLPGYRQLGLFAISGIWGAALFSLFAMPLLIPRRIKPFRKKPFVDLSVFYKFVFHVVPANRKFVYVLIILISLMALPGAWRLEFDGDMNNLNAASEGTIRDRDMILKVFGDPAASGTIAVKGKKLEEALIENEKAYEELLKMKADGKIKALCSVSPLFPSLSAAGKNSLRWKSFWNAERLSALRDATANLCAKYGMKNNSFEDFINSLSKGIPPYNPLEIYENAMMKNIFSNMISGKKDETFIVSKFDGASPENFKTVAEKVGSAAPGAIVYQGSEFVRYITGMIYGESGKTGAISLLFIGALIWICQRKIKTVAITLLPLLVNILWTFGLLGWLGVKVNLMNCIISIFVFGLLIDYCIFLTAAAKTDNIRDYLQGTGGAVTFSALTTIAGLGALMAGGHPALFSLGLSSAVGMASGLLAVFTIIPALCHKEFGR